MVGGWGWGRKTVRAGLVLSRLTPRLPDAAGVGGPEDLGRLVRSGRGVGTSGSPWPGAPLEGSHSPGRRLVGSGPRSGPCHGSAGAEQPRGRSSSFHFLIRGPRPRAVIGAGGQVVMGWRGMRVCVCAGVCCVCCRRSRGGKRGREGSAAGKGGGGGGAGGPNFGSGEHLTAAGGGEGGRGGRGERGGASPSPEKRQREKN